MNANSIVDFFNALIPYKDIFTLLLLIPALVIFAVLLSTVISKLHDIKEQQNSTYEKQALKTVEFDSISSKLKKGYLQRVIASPEGVNPLPNRYFIISDAGKELFCCSFTIDKLPSRTTFANTFSELMNFNDCTTSIFIHKLTEVETTRKMDRQIVTLESEFISAQKNDDPNRRRKLTSQYSDLEHWAIEVETGENSFYEVGFLFTLRAPDLQALTRLCDNFHSLGLEKSIELSACFGVQPEAYMSNVPMVHAVKFQAGPVTDSAIKYHWLDKYSLSTIFNHTQGEFSHKNGIILGRNMQTGKPITYDVYDPSHDGFTILICGKTGCGKSATIKIMAQRYNALKSYKFVAIDSQPRGNVGEYAGLAQVLNGTNFLIKAGTNNIMNVFELSETTKADTSGTAQREYRTVEVASKVSEVVNTILTMIQGDKSMDEFSMVKTVGRVVTDIVAELYADIGIIDGDPDSLYMEGVDFISGSLTTGRVKKTLPTLTDFYKKTLLKNRDNQKEELNEAYNIIISSMKDFVKELYYSERSIKFFSRDEYNNLPVKEGSAIHQYIKNGVIENVVVVQGIKSYFDGQSTVSISKDCPFTNLDISQMPDSEKVLARQIAIDFVNENFIKKNSESFKKAECMAVIFDEAHENFAFEYARKTIDNVVRTARKRHVSIWISTQSLAEFDRYEETRSILRNAAAKFIFKQDFQDRDYLVKTLNLTDGQVDTILDLGGNPSDPSKKNTRRGEVCICDTSKVAFCKVQYLKQVESYAVETDAEEVKKIFGVA